jgi:hypothetical protein
MANAHSYLEYYFRALCAVTEGASALDFFRMHLADNSQDMLTQSQQSGIY